jgi:hypothetical protein
LVIDPNPINGEGKRPEGGGYHDRQEWVRANFSQIFGTSAEDLQSQGVDPRQYAREHTDQIRQFAQMQRRMGVEVPGGRPSADGSGVGYRGFGYGGGGRFGMGTRGGSAWIGILVALFALRFVLIDSFAGGHAAIYWVLGIGGIMLIARVLLHSWLRNRRRHPR